MADQLGGAGFDAIAAMINSATPEAFYVRATALDAAAARLEDIERRFQNISREIDAEMAGATADGFTALSTKVAASTGQVVSAMLSPGWGAQLRQAGDALATAQQRIRDLQLQRRQLAAAAAAAPADPAVEQQFVQLAQQLLQGLSGSYEQSGSGITPLPGASANTRVATGSVATFAAGGGTNGTVLPAVARSAVTASGLPGSAVLPAAVSPGAVPDAATAGAPGMGAPAMVAAAAFAPALAGGAAGGGPAGGALSPFAVGAAGVPGVLGGQSRLVAEVVGDDDQTASGGAVPGVALSMGVASEALGKQASSARREVDKARPTPETVSGEPVRPPDAGDGGTAAIGAFVAGGGALPAVATASSYGAGVAHATAGGPAPTASSAPPPVRPPATDLTAVNAASQTVAGPPAGGVPGRSAAPVDPLNAAGGHPMMPMTGGFGAGVGPRGDRETDRQYDVAFENDDDAWNSDDGAPAALGRPERRPR